MNPLKLTAPEQSEDDLQRQVAEYLDRCRPWIVWCHVPNGGHRDVRVAARLKSLGVKRGVPDILVFEEWVDETQAPCHGFGLALELKSRKGRTSIDQDGWLTALEERGWLVAIPRTFAGARMVIDKAVRR